MVPGFLLQRRELGLYFLFSDGAAWLVLNFLLLINIFGQRPFNLFPASIY